MKNIILIGVQGCGKGTVANYLKEKYGYVHISTGDILRAARDPETELGRKIIAAQDLGALVDDETVFEALEKRILMPDCENGYILDGFPRNIAQAKGYEEILSKLNRNLGVVINLDVPRDILMKRITGRVSCKECGAIYNIYLDETKPKKDNECDKCGIPLYRRDDDANEEAVNNRINTYYETTEPLLKYYEEKNVLYKVDASISKDYTNSEVERIIEE